MRTDSKERRERESVRALLSQHHKRREREGQCDEWEREEKERERRERERRERIVSMSEERECSASSHQTGKCCTFACLYVCIELLQQLLHTCISISSSRSRVRTAGSYRASRADHFSLLCLFLRQSFSQYSSGDQLMRDLYLTPDYYDPTASTCTTRRDATQNENERRESEREGTRKRGAREEEAVEKLTNSWHTEKEKKSEVEKRSATG